MGIAMDDERLEQLSGVENSEATLRDEPSDDDETVELSISDIEALGPVDVPSHAVSRAESTDSETTDVIERGQLEQTSPANPTADNLRATAESSVDSELTFEHHVPEEVLEKTVPTTQKMQAIGTRPMPKIESPEETDDPERTAVRSTDSGEWAELDDEGFYTFIARVDEEGRIKLPEVLFEGREPGDGVMAFVRAKTM
jgi:hypothetical protein